MGFRKATGLSLAALTVAAAWWLVTPHPGLEIVDQQSPPARVMPPKVEVVNTTVEPHYVFGKTAAEIRKITLADPSRLPSNISRDQGATEEGMTSLTWPHGLHRTNISLDVGPPVNGIITGRYETVNVSAGYDQIDVYVADYPANSCQYNVILRHESTHVANARNTLARAMPALRAAIQAAVDKGPVTGRTDDEVKAAGVARIEAAAATVLDPVVKETVRLDAALDSLASYRALSKQCPHW